MQLLEGIEKENANPVAMARKKRRQHVSEWAKFFDREKPGQRGYE